ncbi:MAG: hypothetical protein Q9215_007318, partial [Flavoplaca cf. flavocitrina]
MSLAGSPTFSGRASPASQRSASPLELTPGSKVKAMMAAIENDSDSDELIRAKINHARSFTRHLHAGSPKSEKESDGTSDSSGENHLQKQPAPRGKLASRLQANSAPVVEDHRSDSDNGDAYARLKKKLANPSPTSHGTRTSPNPMQDSSDTEGDIITGMATKRRNRAPLAQSTEPEPHSPHRKSPGRQSPGLFITPVKSRGSKSPQISLSGQAIDRRRGSDSDSSADAQAKSRLLELVARKREQRLEKEAELAEKARARELALEDSRHQKNGPRDLQLSNEESDGSSVEKLTQHLRPTRKASKKAEEENKRQIQRMSRNMQLAHQARTRKKITKESLFARFNFRTDPSPANASHPANSSSAAASSDRASDDDALAHAESPPTSPMISPATPGNEDPKLSQPQPRNPELSESNAEEQLKGIEEGFPDIQHVITKSQERLRGDKRLAACNPHRNYDIPIGEATTPNEKAVARKIFRARLQKPAGKPDLAADSGSDLEILPTKGKRRKVDKVFARLPSSKSNEGHSLQTLRALAHLTSPNKQRSGTKPSMSLSEMQNSLQKRARQQAARERAEKIQELKDRGVIIQTAEERQKDQAEVEDLLEKARREAVDLKQQEKDKARKEARANGEAVADDTSEDDEDYPGDDADESDVELSGSEEEGEIASGEGGDNIEEGNGSQEEEEQNHSPSNDGLIMNEASEDSGENDDEKLPTEDSEAVSAEEEELRLLPPRSRHKKVIYDDDEEESQEQPNEKISPTQILIHPNPLGLPAFGVAPMGMTQAFAATMADSQTQEEGRPDVTNPGEDSLAFLGPAPEPEFMDFDMQESPQMIVDSQSNDASNVDSQANISLQLSQYQAPVDSLQDPGPGPGLSSTQLSEMPDPTQDIGFALSSPVPARFASMPPSTVDTVILPRVDEPNSPAVKKKGRLRRKTDVAPSKEYGNGMDAEQEQGNTVMSENAFDVLKKGLKTPSNMAQSFDKKKSNAKEMVEEQAQESEDEYAGLGGASDDESHGEEDEEVRKMIEQGDVDVDERQLAAFYADKERASDEKAVEKLFKDINNGMLRRKRGADFDLSDSDDDVEARRRRKRKEFAKMRKALLGDENVGKIAEDPKKVAFLRAIEDREDEEDLYFLERLEGSSQPAIDVDSQGKPDSQAGKATEDSQTTGLSKRKRPLTDSNPESTNRLPPAARRTTTMRKPLSLAEIRASVSFLIEEPDAMYIAPPSSSPVASDNENDENDQNNEDTAMNPPANKSPTNKNGDSPFASRRRPNPVIDRLSLKRDSSSTTSASTTNPSHLAFHNPSTTSSTIFKIPSLLRRATTSSFSINNGQDCHGISTLAETERSAGGMEKGEFVRRGGTKRSS